MPVRVELGVLLVNDTGGLSDQAKTVVVQFESKGPHHPADGNAQAGIGLLERLLVRIEIGGLRCDIPRLALCAGWSVYDERCNAHKA